MPIFLRLPRNRTSETNYRRNRMVVNPSERNRVEWHEEMGLGEKQSELNKGKCLNQKTSRNVSLVKAA